SDRIVAPVRRQASVERPMTALEREIAAVWCEVLGVPSAGPDDDFFALGGNSLRAVRAVARLGAGRQATVAQLFAAPTVAAFAAELERAVELPAPAGASPITRRPRVPRRPEPQTQTGRKQEEWQWTSV
ncbi:phosphopantetheine-binding protein, partial [Streptomyces sp. Wh19]